MKWQYDDAFDTIAFNVGAALTSRGVDFDTDVTEMIFMVKGEASDADVDALATLTLGDGITKNLTDGQAIIQFRSTDFGVGKLEVNTCAYDIGLGFKTVATPKFVEFKLKDNELFIVEDFIHD